MPGIDDEMIHFLGPVAQPSGDECGLWHESGVRHLCSGGAKGRHLFLGDLKADKLQTDDPEMLVAAAVAHAGVAANLGVVDDEDNVRADGQHIFDRAFGTARGEVKDFDDPLFALASLVDIGEASADLDCLTLVASHAAHYLIR